MRKRIGFRKICHLRCFLSKKVEVKLSAQEKLKAKQEVHLSNRQRKELKKRERKETRVEARRDPQPIVVDEVPVDALGALSI